MRALLIGALLLLGACTLQIPINLPGSLQQQPAADLSVTVPIPGSVPAPACPPKVAYTAEQNAVLNAYLNDPASNQVIVGFLADYHNTRVADDKCLHPK